MENKKVVLGLSGGVDSAVCARLLLENGYRVFCVYLDNGVGDPAPARAAAEELGLRLDVIDICPALEEQVCKPFAAAYLAGKTPSPCALCNPTVKFAALLAVADELHAPLVATGHYARSENGLLKKGRAPNDQSYLLARLRPEQIARCIFPLGGLEKSQVRALAAEFGLGAAERPDSMEICFIPDNDYAAWLEERGCAAPPGNFVDLQGNVLGRHGGIHRYTLGQGSGLGLSGPHKYYVSAIRPRTNEVVLSDGSDLLTRTVRVGGLHLLVPHLPRVVTARFRHSRIETPATLESLGEDEVLVHTQEDVRAPTPGQLAVFYDGDTVAASAWIN